MKKPKETPLAALARLRDEKANLDRRQREASEIAAVDLGRMILKSGLPLEQIEELPSLLERVASIGLPEAMMRLAPVKGAKTGGGLNQPKEAELAHA